MLVVVLWLGGRGGGEEERLMQDEIAVLLEFMLQTADSRLVPTNETEGVGPPSSLLPCHTARPSDPAQIMESFPSVLKISDKGFDGDSDM